MSFRAFDRTGLILIQWKWSVRYDMNHVIADPHIPDHDDSLSMVDDVKGSWYVEENNCCCLTFWQCKSHVILNWEQNSFIWVSFAQIDVFYLKHLSQYDHLPVLWLHAWPLLTQSTVPLPGSNFLCPYGVGKTFWWGKWQQLSGIHADFIIISSLGALCFINIRVMSG